MSGLIYRLDQVPDDLAGVTCSQCQTWYPADELPVLGDAFHCAEDYCGCGGMVPKHARRVRDRFPESIAEPFTPLPDALGDVAQVLNIHPHGLLVIWALERHRRRAGDHVWPSLERLGRLTNLSADQVKRATSRLVAQQLISRGRRKDGTSVYDLEPLWTAVATAHQCAEASQVGP